MGATRTPIAEDGGAAKATASDGADEVVAGAVANCKATATGSGTGGEAAAVCENAGSVVTVTATKGSIAVGSDTVCADLHADERR